MIYDNMSNLYVRSHIHAPTMTFIGFISAAAQMIIISIYVLYVNTSLCIEFPKAEMKREKKRVADLFSACVCVCADADADAELSLRWPRSFYTAVSYCVKASPISIKFISVDNERRMPCVCAMLCCAALVQ